VELQFLGADRQVTGSRHVLAADGAKVMVDCGMFQERAYLDRNWEPCPVDPGTLDAVLLTHAHLDHCGWLPRLVAEGYQGPIFMTAATADLIDILLHDAAHIQVEDAAYKRRRHKKEGRRASSIKHPVAPLFVPEDVEGVLRQIEPVSYRQPIKINDHLSATFHDAGHILGSAIVEAEVAAGGQARRVVFSGDLGKWDTPIVHDPTLIELADYVVCESTYGDRDRQNSADVASQLAEIIRGTVEAGGNVVIPVFALERTQEVMYHISRLVRENRIPKVPIYIDSPMAVDVTEVFGRHRDCFDDEAWKLIDAGEPPLRFPGLVMSRTVEESKAINESKDPSVIMATSGMCTAGRIKFHLRQNIGRPESTILFVGYQVAGTLGRQIVDGRPMVRIHGRQWKVKARVERIEGFSGHADRGGLIRWLRGFQSPPRRLFVVHGAPEASESLAAYARDEMGWQATVPEYGQRMRLE
jgi:metallo-beta-lactamase family protein